MFERFESSDVYISKGVIDRIHGMCVSRLITIVL